MRIRLISVVLALVAFGSVGAVSGATILYDDFNGTELNTSKWSASASDGASASVNSSELTLATTTGDWPSVNVYSGVECDTGAVAFTLGASNMSGAVNFGFHTAPGGGSVGIEVGNDRGGWRLWVGDGTNNYLSDVFTAPKADDVWTIVRASDSIKVYDNGTLLATDTTLLPIGAQRVHMSVYTEYGVSSVGFHSVSLTDAVPEPSTMLLLTSALIGLMAYAWRRRKSSIV